MNWRQKHKAQALQVGDTIAYSKQFLQSISAYTGDLPRARGKITALIPVGKEVTLAEIDWNLPDIPPRVNVKILCLASHIAFEL
jgi:hypothetical protein